MFCQICQNGLLFLNGEWISNVERVLTLGMYIDNCYHQIPNPESTNVGFFKNKTCPLKTNLLSENQNRQQKC